MPNTTSARSVTCTIIGHGAENPRAGLRAPGRGLSPDAWPGIALRLACAAGLAVALTGCKRTPAADEAAMTTAPDDSQASTPPAAATSESMADQGKEVASRIGGAVSSAMSGLSTDDYLAKAGQGDRFEIESSQAVLKTTRDSAVARFARMMIAAHTHSTAKLREAARAAGIVPPAPTLSDAMQRTLDAIRNAPPDQVDRLYLKAQHDAHADALTLHRTYAKVGGSRPLRDAAAAIAPEVSKHIDALDALDRDGKGPA